MRHTLERRLWKFYCLPLENQLSNSQVSKEWSVSLVLVHVAYDKCVYVCVYVCMWWVYVCMWWVCGVVVYCPVLSWAEFKSNSGNFFPSDFPSASTSPTSPLSCDWVPGIRWGANSRLFLGLRVPTPLAVRKGLFSFACTAHSACLVHRHPGPTRCA